MKNEREGKTRGQEPQIVPCQPDRGAVRAIFRELLMQDRIDPRCPSTFMRLHRDATVIIEKKLADEIGYKG